MYRKIAGLNQLKKMGFPYPPYQVIDITEDKPTNVEEYVLGKIKQVGIPDIKGDRIGVTIRVSMPGPLDKVAKHGGLHVTEERDVLNKVLDRYHQYRPNGKIIVQHTVDARCSGTLLKENSSVTIESIFGDAPSLLEGEVTNYERWVFLGKPGVWKKEKRFLRDNKEVDVLRPKDIENIQGYINSISSRVAYLEWSISRTGKLYFYEYYELKS